jgi:hypothetical protein
MRRTIALVLLGLGGFLLVVGILALAWVPGAVKKTPLDVDTTTLLTGEAAKLDTATGAFEPETIHAISVTRTDSEASTDDAAVWAQTQCAIFGAEAVCPAAPEGEEVHPDVISAAETTFATDRVTAEGVPIDDLPEGTLPADALPVEGLVNKFPFDTEKRTYPYWEGTVERAVDAVYDRTEEVEGVETYVFVVEVADEPIAIGEGIDGTYSDRKEIFVEPKTGSILNQTDDQQRWLADGTQVLDLQLAFTDEQIQSNADDAEKNMAQLKLMTQTLPIVGLVGGGILVLVGALLALSGRNRGPRAEDDADRALVNA